MHPIVRLLGIPFAIAAATCLTGLVISCENGSQEPDSNAPGPKGGAGAKEIKPETGAPHGPALTCIAFGSCSKQRKNREQSIWTSIIAQAPEVFLFMGDNIYADTTDMKVMRAKYQELADQPGYQKLRSSATVLATWDDHDYGANDAGAGYPMREESQKEFLRFFGVPEASPRWSRRGVYSEHIFGPLGRRAQIILLDTRYFRSALVENPESEQRKIGYYQPNTDKDATILGEEQWKWLEVQLKKPADVRILVSSIQVVPSEQLYEKWANIPAERTRLFKLIKDTNANGVILLSGDRHLAEVSRLPIDDPESAGYPLTEFTSSGLSEGSGSQDEVNRYRAGPGNFRKPNFGLIRMDWDKAGGAAALVSIRDASGNEVFAYDIPLESLKP